METPPPDASLAPGLLDAPAARAPDQAYSLRWLLLAWFPGAALIVLAATMVLRGGQVLPSVQQMPTIAFLLSYLPLLFWLLASAKRSGLSLATTFGARPRAEWLADVGFVAWMHLFLNMGLFMLLLAALHLFMPAWSRALGESGGKALGFDHTAVWLRWVIIVGLAPITEEWLFRGMLYHRFARRWGPGRSQVVTSLIFALMHMNPFGIFAFGMLLQSLYRRTRSLGICMLAHALNNAIPLALLGSARGAGPSDSVKATELERIASLWPVWLLLSAALVGVLVWHLRRHWPSRDEASPWTAGAAEGSAVV